MSHGRDKFRSRRNRIRVREILWREWDPIGVNTFPEAFDEYHTYADAAYVMLMNQQKSAEEIADYLFYIASEHMGLGPRPDLRVASQRTANKLFSLTADFKAESNDPF